MSGSNGQSEDPIEEYLDQIDDLTHKLSVAESKLASLQSGRKSARNFCFVVSYFFNSTERKRG